MTYAPEIEQTWASANPGLGLLLKFDFASGTKRVFTGFGKLKTVDGQVWEAIGDVVSVDGLAAGIGTRAPAGRIVLSGASAEMMQKAVGERADFQGRPLSIFLQAFQGVRELVGPPLPWGMRIMTSIELNRTGSIRTIVLNHESLMIGRNNPAAASYSDRSQQYRYPGDLGCERLSTLVNKKDAWPEY